MNHQISTINPIEISFLQGNKIKTEIEALSRISNRNSCIKDADNRVDGIIYCPDIYDNALTKDVLHLSKVRDHVLLNKVLRFSEV